MRQLYGKVKKTSSFSAPNPSQNDTCKSSRSLFSSLFNFSTYGFKMHFYLFMENDFRMGSCTCSNFSGLYISYDVIKIHLATYGMKLPIFPASLSSILLCNKINGVGPLAILQAGGGGAQFRCGF